MRLRIHHPSASPNAIDDFRLSSRTYAPLTRRVLAFGSEFSARSYRTSAKP
jgi:hypothetical protein